VYWLEIGKGGFRFALQCCKGTLSKVGMKLMLGLEKATLGGSFPGVPSTLLRQSLHEGHC